MSTELHAIIATKLPDWKIIDNKLTLELKTKNWSESMSIANMVSFLAEKYDHHPDLIIRYSSVTISYFTHISGEITNKDITLAQLIDKTLKEQIEINK